MVDSVSAAIVILLGLIEFQFELNSEKTRGIHEGIQCICMVCLFYRELVGSGIGVQLN